MDKMKKGMVIFLLSTFDSRDFLRNGAGEMMLTYFSICLIIYITSIIFIGDQLKPSTRSSLKLSLHNLIWSGSRLIRFELRLFTHNKNKFNIYIYKGKMHGSCFGPIMIIKRKKKR
jgi:hypothetical protein